MKNTFTKTVPIKGMHCRSCEILISEGLKSLQDVQGVEVSEKDGTAVIRSSKDISDKEIEKVVLGCGYSIGKEEKIYFSKNPKDYEDLLKAFLALFFVVVLLDLLGAFRFTISNTCNLASLGVVMLIGLAAGVSTCMALVGGLVLGVSARYSEQHRDSSTLKKLTPHIFFNLGRALLFAVFGAMIGYFGSFIQLAPSNIGYVTIFVGLFMLLLGLQTLQIFPILDRVKITLPKVLYSKLGISDIKNNRYSHLNSFVLGGLTFFVPCGFTQAMQLYAISSGSAVTGALTMGAFALGTIPGLISMGGVLAIVRGKFAELFYKFVGLAVVGMALFNISNGFNLTGLSFPNFYNQKASRGANEDSIIKVENNVQVVKMTQSYSGYSPRTFTVKKGVPVKWVIESVDTNSCANNIYSAQLGINQILKPGENIIEFTPNSLGIIKFSCSMGMFTGSFNVI